MIIPAFDVEQLRPLIELRRALLEQELRRHSTFQDWCIRHLMQFWQSELEPEICWTTGGELLGLGHAGRVLVPVRWLAHATFSDA